MVRNQAKSQRSLPLATVSSNGILISVKVDIVVIGDGQAGLSSAYHLRRI